MNTWNEVMHEVQNSKITAPDGKVSLNIDAVRRKKMQAVKERTGRPLIIYAVDFLNHKKAQDAGPGIRLDSGDKEGFNEVTQNIDAKEVDVLVHSPGGSAEAAHSFVEILRSKFSSVRFIVPNIAKSAATMLVLSGDEILLNSASELGPIDPQLVIIKGDGSRIMSPAQAIIDQFKEAQNKISDNPKLLTPWLPILQQYGPSLYREAQNAIDLSKELVRKWLKEYMFKGDAQGGIKAGSIARYLSNHNNFKSHAKRIGLSDITTIRALKHLKVFNLEQKDKELNNRLWGLYHAMSITFALSGAFKIFENTEGGVLIISFK